MRSSTQVGIVGAGPAGLFLSHLLHLAGIDSIVVEDRTRDYVEHRVRAGVLEQGTVDLMRDTGLSDRMDREGLVHRGIEIRFDGRRFRVPMSDLAGGRAITIYGQQEVVKDLIAARLAAGGDIRFEVDDVRIEGIDGSPSIRYSRDGQEHIIECDFVAGCDGFHGVSRATIPAGVLTEYHHEFPFAWLGILAAVAPSTDELIYARHDLGFALHSLRSPSISRLYIQVDPTEDIDDWPDDRIWEQLRIRLATEGWELRDGPVIEKNIAPMRSFVVEPMQFGRLYLAGDAAHIVPATGAKGLNLAVADVFVLARALTEWYARGDGHLLEQYSATCLRRVWRAQEFSNYMSAMLHRYPGDDPFRDRLQLARLETLTVSEPAARALSVNYTGLPLP
ncbi:MAG TPA: 4-hydroxybenzoate 3-monooxygenase [Candidatus Limnocylindrales bacterium]